MADDYAADEGVTIDARDLRVALYLAGRRQDADHYAAGRPDDPAARLDLATLARAAARRSR